MSDLDGFSVAGDSYYPQIPQSFVVQSDEFGFDPPFRKPSYPTKMEQTYSPADDASSFSFDFDPVQKEPMPIRALELDRMVAQNISNSVTAVSRYGQVTPPRSNSEPSVEGKSMEEKQVPVERRRRASRISSKEEQQLQPTTTTGTTTTGRKRRNTRKNSTATDASGNPEEDEKRKQSLEKNRLAAAKCRVNKKEKTEQLQRDSHDKAVQNAFLKEQVMRMKEEVQQMNALLLAHANCEGCKSPEDIQKHLNNLGQEFFNSHMAGLHHEFSGFGSLPVDMGMDHDNYFSPASNQSLINPPLPEFDREPEFDVSTPMHND
ncbi:hypothetical protein H2198_003917 [Neophaeococcomyces mojaviensis]|uniref:Uncharacterized protein n=1 Tax=Neophaeococcomyces mojaviensis TaxID=3383035 RepID=A0ACC3AAC5_9EURO|nr:hypothetical protein H2198_003917 [Knufia sp. JES_112]